MTAFDREIDTSGLNCPIPILRAKKALASMEPGQVLHVIATDPGSIPDFQAYAAQGGHELLQCEQVGEHYEFLLRKA